MLQHRLRRWLLLSLLTAGTLLITALPRFTQEGAVPVMAGARTAAAAPRLFVDGTEIPCRFLSADGSRLYAEAEAFLGALDADCIGETGREGLRCPTVSIEGKLCLCVQDFCAVQGIAVLDAGPEGFWCDSAAGSWALAEGRRVPVLMYHGVGDDLWTSPELYVRPSELEQQIRWLLQQGYTPIRFSELRRLREIEKPVILSFDDGYSDLYTELFPLLCRYQIPAELMIVPGYLDKSPQALTRAELREMLDSGLVAVQSHTLWHGMLDELDASALEQELCWSKVELAKLTGRIPFVIAYPCGRVGAEALAVCRREYRFGLCMSGKCWVTGDDPLLIHRVYVPRGMSLSDFAAQIER